MLSPTPTPHDAFFKAVFVNPDNAGGALRAMVPSAIAEALDWSTLASTDGSFVDEALRPRITDLLFTARWRSGDDALVYVLYEHQSSVDESMAFRLLRYLVRIWERWRNERRTVAETHALPLIVPVVIYHGSRPWTAPTSLRDSISVPSALQPLLAPHVIDFTYILEDLSQIPDDELHERKMSALAEVAMLCFKHVRSAHDFMARVRSWRDLLRHVQAAPNGREAIGYVIHYIMLANSSLRSSSEGWAPFLDFIEHDLGPQTKEIAVTIAESLIEQGMQQGLQQGMQQGLQKGRLEQALLATLHKRFGEQADAERARVEQASIAQLERWLERSIDAPTLADALRD